MNSRLNELHPYPFERLRVLLNGLTPPPGLNPINLGIGEPQHQTPKVITDALTANFGLLGKYPPTGGSPELRLAISNWIGRRYGIPEPDPDTMVLPVSGTREALFAFVQAVMEPKNPGAVVLPNPFYQIYEGGAIMAGARPLYLPTPRNHNYLPDWGALTRDEWASTKLLFVCSPGNPAGAVFGMEDWRIAFDLADRYGFVIAADECYSEIFNGEPPIGALEAAHRLGRTAERIVAFNSLSKRSSSPGLRSGFVAGDPEILRKFLLYRTYHGAAPSSMVQAASVAAWSDESHVQANRAKYREKFVIARKVLGLESVPEGGFFLWLPVEDDEAFARRAFEEQGLTMLPGRYLSRAQDSSDPGAGHIRVALVAEPEVCAEALERLRKLLSSLGFGGPKV
ncbi:MAG: succinyldiaminopimelate transaminase [Fimbriimonas sp.]